MICGRIHAQPLLVARSLLPPLTHDYKWWNTNVPCSWTAPCGIWICVKTGVIWILITVFRIHIGRFISMVVVSSNTWTKEIQGNNEALDTFTGSHFLICLVLPLIFWMYFNVGSYLYWCISACISVYCKKLMKVVDKSRRVVLGMWEICKNCQIIHYLSGLYFWLCNENE